MKTENWKYDIDAKVPLDAICPRVDRHISRELPAAMSHEDLKHAIGKFLWSKVEIKNVEIMPTVDGKYLIENNYLKRVGDDKTYPTYGMPIKGLKMKKGKQYFNIRNGEIVQDDFIKFS